MNKMNWVSDLDLYWVQIKLGDWTYLNPLKLILLEDEINEHKVFVSHDPRIDNVKDYLLTEEQMTVVNAWYTIVIDEKQKRKTFLLI